MSQRCPSSKILLFSCSKCTMAIQSWHYKQLCLWFLSVKMNHNPRVQINSPTKMASKEMKGSRKRSITRTSINLIEQESKVAMVELKKVMEDWSKEITEVQHSQQITRMICRTMMTMSCNQLKTTNLFTITRTRNQNTMYGRHHK